MTDRWGPSLAAGVAFAVSSLASCRSWAAELFGSWVLEAIRVVIVVNIVLLSGWVVPCSRC